MCDVPSTCSSRYRVHFFVRCLRVSANSRRWTTSLYKQAKVIHTALHSLTINQLVEHRHFIPPDPLVEVIAIDTRAATLFFQVMRINVSFHPRRQNPVSNSASGLD